MDGRGTTDHEEAIRHLRRSALFSAVDESELQAISPPPVLMSLKAGEVLIHQGDSDHDYYLLVSGRLRVFVHGADGRRTAVGHVLPGEGVGEMALLTREPRSATVVARLDSLLVRFPQASFLRLAERHSSAALEVARTVVRRLKDQMGATRKANAFATIALVPIGPSGTTSLARSLAGKLAAFGRTHAVFADDVGTLVDAGTQALADRLSGAERDNDFLVLGADDSAGPWARYCMLRADLILLVVAAKDANTAAVPPLLGEIDRDLLGRLDLLIVHPADWQRDPETARWQAACRPQEHHHLRAGRADDLARLARIVAGRANNVVLGGGGARGFAQIGAMRALDECGVPIDRIGGTSMGALMAALRAFGTGSDEMLEICREHFVTRRPTREPTLPALSLVVGRKIQQLIVDICGTWRIEDLPVRYFCVSADLGNVSLVEHFAGPLWPAVRASGSVPVVVPPVFLDGRVLVDGAVLNNLPVDVMRRHFSGPVVAVDVSNRNPLTVDARWDLATPSGFRILLRRLNPFGRDSGLPSIMEVWNRTITLSSELQQRLMREQADLLVTPPVEEFGMFDVKLIDAIVERGYRQTRTMLEALRDDPQRRETISWH